MVLGGICCGMIADKWQCHRTVVTLVCLVSLSAIATQPVVSVYYGNPQTNKCPSPFIKNMQTVDVGTNSNSTIAHCENNTSCTNWNNTNTELNEKITNSKSNYESGTLYILMFFINFCFAFSEGSSVTFVDSGALRRSQLSMGGDRPIQYGRQRMFASLGATFGILVMNLSVDLFPENTKITCYTGIFVSYGFYTILYGSFTIFSYRGLSFREAKEKIDGELGKEKSDANNKDEAHELSSTQLEKDLTRSNDLKQQPTKSKSKNFWKIFVKTFFQYNTLFFYLTTLISGLEYSQYTSFLFVYLKEMDAPSSLLTIAIILSNFASGLCFAYAAKIIRLLGGKWRALLFSFFMYFVRYMGISLIRNPWLIFLIQPMHGITATLFVATGLMHLKETSPLPVITTLVSIFNAIHYGLGTFIGSSISGVIYQRYGGRALFRYTALLSIVWFCVLAVYVFFKERRERKDAKRSVAGFDDTNLIEQHSNKEDEM